MEGKQVPVLGRDAVKSAVDVEFRDVDVPEWGGTLRLRTLTAEEAMQFAEGDGKFGHREAALRVIMLCAIDEKGDRIFSDEDLPMLRKRSMKIILRVQRVAMELNGLGDFKKEQEAAKNA